MRTLMNPTILMECMYQRAPVHIIDLGNTLCVNIYTHARARLGFEADRGTKWNHVCFATCSSDGTAHSLAISAENGSQSRFPSHFCGLCSL